MLCRKIMYTLLLPGWINSGLLCTLVPHVQTCVFVDTTVTLGK